MDIGSIAPLIVEYRYWILVPLAFLEGPLVAFTAGLLSSLGYLNVFIVLAILIGKDIAVDALFYVLGRWGNRRGFVKRWSARIGLTEEHWSEVRRLWDTHPWKTMFVSKIAYGLSYPFLVSAGLSNISYRKFWYYAIQISFLQYGALTALGYYFGNSLSSVQNVLLLAQIAVAGLTVFAIIYYVISVMVRNRMFTRDDSRSR